jgi:small subunit ribosomal protein S11
MADKKDIKAEVAEVKEEQAVEKAAPVKEKKTSTTKKEAKSEAVVGAEEETEESSASVAAVKRAKTGRVVPSGIAVINATFNNTKVTFTDLHGNTLCWSSGGKMGMKGSRKSTAYAAQMIATDAAKRAQSLGMREVEVKIKGPGAGRESAVRGIAAAGMEISALKDITPVPHNGCRPKKRRRV